VELPNRQKDLALWRKTVEICHRCLELDREMLAKLGPDDFGSRDAEEYLDPKIWEQFIEAREDLVDFTTSSISVLTRGERKPPPPSPEDETDEARRGMVEQAELEKRLVKSLKEMVELEAHLAKYLNENLSVLKETIDGLSKNQVLFTSYAKSAPRSHVHLLNTEA
jgi:hypothetical protein